MGKKRNKEKDSTLYDYLFLFTGSCDNVGNRREAGDKRAERKRGKPIVVSLSCLVTFQTKRRLHCAWRRREEKHERDRGGEREMKRMIALFHTHT